MNPMTPEYRKASIKVLADWAEANHPNPEAYLRTLAETPDEGLDYILANGSYDQLVPLTKAFNDRTKAHPNGAHQV